MPVSVPKISIITPCFNRDQFIREAVQSVAAQEYPDIEHIIVDGGSTDRTLAVLAEYPGLTLVSEPDQGMYDALNKGLGLAQGEIIGFLNTDDLYPENIFAEVAQAFRDPQILAIAGEALVFTGDPTQPIGEILHFSPLEADLLTLATIGNPFFNAWFFRKSVFETLGKFDINYRVVADRDFMLRFALSGLKYAPVNQLFYRYRQHSGSMTFEITDQKFERIVNEHLRMTGFFLRQSGLPKTARSLLRQFRTRETIKMTAISLKSGDLKKSYPYLLAGMDSDPFWLLNFLGSGMRYLIKTLLRRNSLS